MRLYSSESKLHDAASSFRDAIAVQPDYVAAHGRLAFVLNELGRPEQAADHWHRILELEPENLDAVLNLITSSFDRGLFEEVESLLDRALRGHPDRPELHCWLGLHCCQRRVARLGAIANPC